MPVIEIVLTSGCGCELDRVRVGERQDVNEVLERLIRTDWLLDVGDKISIEYGWEEKK